MIWAIGSRGAQAPAPARPVLDLSGPKLRAAFENLVDSAEATGGVERYVGALALKASLFEEVLGDGQVGTLDGARVLRSRRLHHAGAPAHRGMARPQRLCRHAAAAGGFARRRVGSGHG